ncbi:filamentous hemagglutinin N-terminal domain-containing protein [Yersinia mollaretii]|uniref:two-partner secretion domain-containing protein n=1 Tax=Yersinia mollaretii TaxID=33060 RepID=UPI0011A86407|nr:filamentous hemagglutinin N-terminal domain-containing protein [Yersinia mollaretii]MDN0111064.1 filamentous hemagglutinin N-terminal domain-containing protein [Yersinia mollaretii]
MNSKLYKHIFCRRLGCLVAVSEFARSYGQSFSSMGGALIKDNHPRAGILSRLVVMVGLALGTLPSRILANPSLPVNGNIVVGQGSLNVDNTTLTVTQQTDKLAINWGSYDIAQGHTVIYQQPGSQSIALNRVLGSNGSQINGSLKANGQIFLLNPNGVLFGKGAEVNVGGLLASTKSMSDKDFINGRYRLKSRKHEGSIINQANLSVTPGGYIALVGQQVDNQYSGIIETPQGKTMLLAGRSVTLDLDEGRLLGVQIQGEQVITLLQNGGLIKADGGVIQLTARGKDALMNTVIDNSGILQARGLTQKNGVIHLDGGTDGVISHRGAADVSNPQGGGGRAILEGEHIHLVAGSKIDAHGSEGGGAVFVGGGWQGKNNQIRNADSVVMENGASIDASVSRQGDGGTVVLWSERYTHFKGDIHASGGPQSGRGGQVETSSAKLLTAFGRVDVIANRGIKGHWLLDPAEVTIVDSGAETGTSIQVGDIPAEYTSNAQVFTPTANMSQILNSSINSHLDGGANVTIMTSNSQLNNNCQGCNITLWADINKKAGTDVTLTLYADGNINVENNITSDTGKLNLNLLAGNSKEDSMITLNNSGLLLNGGDLVARHAGKNNKTHIAIIGGQHSVSNLTLEGNAGMTSQVGVNLSNAANITAAGEVHISGESSNINGQGGRGIEITDNSSITGSGNMTFTMNSNAKSAWMGSFTNVTIAGDKEVKFVANGTALGGVSLNNSTISAKSGDLSIQLQGEVLTATNQGIYLNGSQVSGQSIRLESHVTGADGILLNGSHINATSGNINANATTTHKGIGISGNSTLRASGNIALNGKTTAIAAGADGIKIRGSSTSNVNMTAEGDISMVGQNSGQEVGTSLVVDYANIESRAGDFNVNMSGTKNGSFTNTNISANTISLNGNITDSDGLVMTHTNLTAKAGDIKTNLTSPTTGFLFKGNGGMTASQNITLVGNSISGTNTNITGNFDAVKINGTSANNRMNISAGNNISIISYNNGSASGTNTYVENANVIANNGAFTSKTSGLKSASFKGVNITASDIDIISDITGSGGVILDNANITAAVGDININTIVTQASSKGIWIKSNSTLSSNRDMTLNGVSRGANEGIIIQGLSESSRNTLSAQGNITLTGKNSRGAGQRSSINLGNVSLISTGKNIDINGSSTSTGDVNFTNVELNATAGNVTVYAETMTALTSSASSVFSMGDNNSIKAKSGSLMGKALNTTQGVGIIFRANNSLSVEGNIAFRGETEGTSAARNGITFYGTNTLDVAKGSQLSLLGENSGAQDTSGGNGIAYVSPKKLTINNHGSLKMEGRSTSGAGINFPTSNNTLILNGDGDTLIKGSSVTGTGVSLSGVVNNSTGPVTLEGTSTEDIGFRLFSAEHQINQINVTGSSTQAEGLIISGNTTITDTTLTGKSINGSGVKIDSLSGSNVVTHGTLDNATLNGTSTHGKGVEITSSIIGINHSTINGITDGSGYGIDIGEGLSVTGTSEADLLMLQGVALTEAGTGIKINGDNDLSNTSLNGSAVDGIALDIIGPLSNSSNTALNGTASGAGMGAYVNGSLSESVVNGTSASGIGVQLHGKVGSSRIKGISTHGSGVKIDGESVLSNTTLTGSSTDGRGVEISANLNGSQSSVVQGTTANDVGVTIERDTTLIGGGLDDLLVINGIAAGLNGSGVTLGGNNTLDNTSLAGKAISGMGIDITGPLVNSNSSVGGKATTGVGVQLDGAVSDGAFDGTSAEGSGIKVQGGTTLDNVTLNGNSADGKGVDIAADLTGSRGSSVQGVTLNGTGIAVSEDPDLTGGAADDLLVISGDARGEKGTGLILAGNNTLDNTSLVGNAIGGIGFDITAPLVSSNSTVEGHAKQGDGVQLNGALSGGTFNGTSAMGRGIKVKGSTMLDNVTLNGSSTDGKGVHITADLTGSEGSAVLGMTVNGTGVALSRDPDLTGGGSDDLLVISGDARGDKGTGLILAGNNTLENTSLSGHASEGHGVEISGPVINKGNSAIEGEASGEGHGVHIDGTVTGGRVNGSSGNSRGVFLDDDAFITEIAIGGKAKSGQPQVHTVPPELIGENVTINGKLFVKAQVVGANNGISPPVPTLTPIPTLFPTSVLTSTSALTLTLFPSGTTVGDGTTTARHTEGDALDSLLMMRSQILSSLEGHDAPSSPLLELAQDSTANISIAICVSGSEQAPCDEHVLGKWEPRWSTRQPK